MFDSRRSGGVRSGDIKWLPGKCNTGGVNGGAKGTSHSSLRSVSANQEEETG
jgi:hypothetical protein